VLGSTIIGLENHTPEGLDAVVEHAVGHGTDFHQFMLYTPMPGTPFYEQISSEGRMKEESECDLADAHGQEKFNYRHPHFPDGDEGEHLLRAFRRDLEANGPSITRICDTLLRGWRRHGEHADPRVRRRVAEDCRQLATTFAAVLGGAIRFYRRDPRMRERLLPIRDRLVAEFGWRARLWAGIGGRFLGWTARREAKRLARGRTYEPSTFYERNAAAMAHSADPEGARLCRQVTIRTPAPVEPKRRARPATPALTR
jgi:hypothetical protein